MRIIVNGKVAGSDPLRDAVRVLREQGVTVDVRVTWEAGDAARYAVEAMSDSVDIIVAAGGDGTINEIVHGLMAKNPKPACALGIVPFGTADDFATGCGLPLGDPLAALNLIIREKPTLIDVAQCNDRFFINVASGGFGAEVTANTPPELKRALGGAAYSLMGLVTAMKMSPYRARMIDAEGRTATGDLFVVAVGNGCQAGGGFQIAPHAKLNDGLLDAMGIVDVTFDQIGNVFNELNDMTAADNRFVKYARLSEFTIESDDPMQMNLDGEPVREKSFHFRVHPAAVRCFLPPDSPLLVRPE